MADELLCWYSCIGHLLVQKCAHTKVAPKLILSHFEILE